jgi:EpsD family peptidyl-prolyl cis-trans isomerase
MSQVAVKVNGDEISIHQVELAMQARAATSPAVAASAATSTTLATLVDQELLAQAARQEGLDRDPKVIQLMEAAKRQVLAQAQQERIGARATDPSSDEIDRYYDAHPELFAKRRLYLLQETIVALPADRFAVLRAQFDGAASVDFSRRLAVWRAAENRSNEHGGVSDATAGRRRAGPDTAGFATGAARSRSITQAHCSISG